MSYQVLARKWRPKSFDTLVGQEHVVRALTHALDQQRLHHAYLFTGTRGVGKTTLSRILAKALNCERGVTATPCGVCSACTEIDSGRFIDYVEMDAASNRGVDEMTSLLEKAIYAPTRGRYKVYMIDEVHQLTGHAFNAMLKTLEEPPEHVKFILATTDPQKIPVTVLSRCLQFNLKQMPPGNIVDHLSYVLGQEGVPFEVAALRQIAKAAAGSMRDALSLLDQAIAHGAGRLEEQGVRDMLGTVGDDHLYAVLDALRGGDGLALMHLAEHLESRSLNFDAALRELGVLLHRVAVLQLAPGAIADEAERIRLTPYAQAFDAEFVQLAYQIVIQGANDLPLAPDESTGFAMTMLRLVAFRPEQPAPLAATPRQAALQVPPARLVVAVERPGTPDVRAGLGEAPLRERSPTPLAEQGEPAAENCLDWHSMLARMRLHGMARQLAHHCEMIGITGETVLLRLASEHKGLLLPSAHDRLQAELAALLGRPVRLSVEPGQVKGETLAQRLSAEQQARRAQALASLEGDDFVQQLIEQFDGELDTSSVQPVERT